MMKRLLLSMCLFGVVVGCAQITDKTATESTTTKSKTALNQKNTPNKPAKTPPTNGVVETRERAAHGLDTSVQVTRYSATKIDLSCENVFESPSLVENGLRLGWPTAANYLSGAIGGQPQLNDQDLKQAVTALSKQMVWLPITAEEKYGEWLHSNLLTDGKIIPPEKLTPSERKRLQQIDETLSSIVKNLPSDSPFKFQLRVSRDPGANAYALPAGYVYVTRDALKGADVDTLTFMLAHEIAHVTKRHKVKEYQVRLIDGATGLSDIRSILSSGSPVNVVAAMTHANALKQMFENYSVAQESEADGCAIKLLANQPNINVVKAAQGFLKKQQGVATGKKQTHPNYPDRLKLISAAYTKFSSTRYVGDKTSAPQSSDANISPLQAAKEKDAELRSGKQQSPGLMESVGNFFTSDDKKENSPKKQP